jgi:hypothetical protein
VTIGEGSYKYEWLGDWAKLPQGKAFGYTHGVATDRNDNVYIFNQSRDALCVFDRDGNFIKSWGENFQKGAHGLFLSREGDEEFLYLTDYELSAVFKTTLDGEVIWTLAAPPLVGVYNTPAEFSPTFACTAPNGDVYVFDGYGKSLVHQYSKDAEYITTLDGTEGAGRFDCPHAGIVDMRGPEPLLLVADRANVRIQVFDLNHGYKGSVAHDLRYPCGFAFDGATLIIPDLHACVTLYDGQNAFAAILGDTPGMWKRPGWPNIPKADRQPGHFSSPHAACADSNGDIYVVEWIEDGRVTKLKRT